MARKLGWMCLVLSLALPATAAAKQGQISGLVKDARGVPQMGAAVEIATAPATLRTVVYTDVKGQYRADNLGPGTYLVKVSAPSFLPSLRENVILRSGAQVVVNLTLNTIFEATNLLPKRRAPGDPEDEWKWTLRSAANRPVLRVLESGPLVVVSSGENENDRVLKAQVSFIAGAEAEGFGSSPEMSTAFIVEHSMFRTGTLSVGGNVGLGEDATGIVRAAYSHRLPNGSEPEIAFTARRFATPESVTHKAAVGAFAVTIKDQIKFGNLLGIEYGGELQTLQFARHVSSPFRPFGAARLHLTPRTVVEYRYSTSQPNTRSQKGFDTAPADLSESGPRMSLVSNSPVLERARHQEISISQRVGTANLQLAFYTDDVRNAALTGMGDAGNFADVLPDVYSGTFSYNGGHLRTSGVRMVAQHKIAPWITSTIDYSYGGTLDAAVSDASWSQVMSSIQTVRRHAIATKLNGKVPRAKTSWLASYRWTSGGALAPVDMFNPSAGHADPFFNVFVRQPIPEIGFLPGGMEALVDVRNLMAQGYVPVISPDGNQMYLVQAARSVRGGVAFTF